LKCFSVFWKNDHAATPFRATLSRKIIGKYARIKPLPYSLRHLALQLVAILLVASLAWPYYAIHETLPDWGLLALATGLCAGTLAWVSRQPLWWRFIHALFLPLAWMVDSLRIDPGWFLLTLIILLLFYRGALSGRIPLYLSNRATIEALLAIADQHQAKSIVDLGAGFGGMVRGLARNHPETNVIGIENAPLTWLIGFIANRTTSRRRSGAIDWRFGSLWQADLGKFDLVYAFLSPEPMPALWEKAKNEMPPGSLLVSNSFPVPDVTPSEIVELTDQRATVLYCYAM
jgi:hypothetical protein